MKLMTSLYGGIGKYTHWDADDFSDANISLVRYYPSPYGNNHHVSCRAGCVAYFIGGHA